MDEQEILAELASVMDALAALPADDFDRRLALKHRQHELRAMLQEAQEAAGRDPETAWSEQAARKQPHSGEAPVFPVLPDETGGAAGGGLG